MTKHRTEIEAAAGKLISAIQKEWGKELGEPMALESEEIINKAHDLLQAAKKGNIALILEVRTISEFLGSSWVEKHQLVKPAIAVLETEARNENAEKNGVVKKTGSGLAITHAKKTGSRKTGSGLAITHAA